MSSSSAALPGEDSPRETAKEAAADVFLKKSRRDGCALSSPDFAAPS